MWRVLIFNKCANVLKTTIRQSKAETTIRTWNVHSLCAYGAHPWVKMLLMLHRGPGQGQMDRVWRNYHEGGTQDLVLWRRLKTPVWGGTDCTERSCTCREYHQLHSHHQQIHLHLDTTLHSFFQVYSLTSHHEDKEGERFYEQLDSITADSQENVIQSNWNARLGPDTYQHKAQAVKRFGVG